MAMFCPEESLEWILEKIRKIKYEEANWLTVQRKINTPALPQVLPPSSRDSRLLA